MSLNKMNIFSDETSGEQDSTVYFIKNKDEVLGSFVWDGDFFVKSLKEDKLPRFIRRDLWAWLESRTPPKHREHMESLLSQCGLENVRSIIDFSKGLSLTDTLWVTPDASLKWENVSLYQNEFDSIISHIAFDGGMYGFPFSTTSPEWGTNGMLAKCWIRTDKGIYLYKAGTEGYSNAGKEPYSEVMAHQLLEVLGYPHVPYQLKKFRGRLVSVCPLFTSEQRSFLPIYKWFDFRTIDELLSLCQDNGVEKGLAQHLVYDYLSWNTDRHAGNLGVLLNSDSFELEEFAPIFDNGCSLLCYWDGKEDLTSYIKHSSPVLYPTFERGAQLGKKILRNNHNVERLIGFTFNKDELPGFDEKRLHDIEVWLQGRVEIFLKM